MAASPVSVWDRLGRALSPVEQRPRVAVEVEAAQFTTRSGTPYVVIHNPVDHTYLKLDPREYELLPLMDGTCTVKALLVEYYQRHGVLALARIAGLVHALHSHRFLAEPPIDAYAVLHARLNGLHGVRLVGRLGRGFLQSELALSGVDTLLARCYRSWGRLFFTRPVVLFGSVLGVLGPLLFYLELTRDRYPLFQAGGSYVAGFFLLLVLGLLALALHELGHGLAVKHAGRTVHRAGFMLYYGLPAAFVDTTDVWMAPRRARLLTSFAGPWTGLVLGGVCALVAVLLSDGPLGALLFAASFVFVLSNLLNFNPLLELDGYYLLVDLLEKPMLRARALGFVHGPLWRKLRLREAFTREERFFALFGLASLVWSLVAIALALRFWQLRLSPLIEEAWSSQQLLPRLGLVLVALLVTTSLALALWSLLTRLPGWLSLRLSQLSGKAAAHRHRGALQALRAVPLWAEVPEGRLLEVARQMRLAAVLPGTEVVRQGQTGDRFYVIARGAFEVLVDGQPVGRLGRGDYFGERALLNDAPRAATVVAVEPSQVFWLDHAAFRLTLAHDLATRARLEAAVAFRADLAEMPLFRDLSPTEMDLLLTRLVPLSAEPDQEIIRQGEPGDRFYVVRSGQVEVVRDGQRLATLGPGESFGEIALLLDVPRTATVRATAPTELLALSAEDFRDLLAGYCGRADELQRLSHLRLETHKRLDQVAA